MLKRALTFIKYHNALPIGISFLLLSVSGAFAASPEARDAVLHAEEHIVSVDNTYIANKDLSTFNPNVQVTGVTEDDEYYYVAYTLTTIDIVAAVWQDAQKEQIIKVSKEFLGGRDLGLYVSEQLKEVLSYQTSYLAEVQQFEKNNGLSHKAIATEYSGLIGKLLDPKVEVFEGYKPVIEPPAVAESNGSDEPPEGHVAGASTSGDTIPPSITVLGDNPARVLQGGTYKDLGATAVDNGSTIVDIVTLGLDALDINTPGTYFVYYKAFDQSQNISKAQRTVIVESAAPQQSSGGEASPPSSSDTPPSDQSAASQNETPDAQGSAVELAPASASAPDQQDEPAPAPAQETNETQTPQEPAPQPAESPTSEPAPQPADSPPAEPAS